MVEALDAAFSRLDQEIEGQLAAHGTPGLSLAVTDRERTLKVGTYGFADLAAQARVTPETVFEIGSRGLEVEIDGRRMPVRTYGDGDLLVDHPDFALFPLLTARDEEEVIALRHGADWYARDSRDQPPVAEYSAEWETLPGHYRCHNPWASSVRVVLRRGNLLLVDPGGGEEPLTPLADGSFRIGPEESPERLRFDAVVDGKALRLNLSGQEFYRSPLS